jgi:hypothetical protein
MRLKLALAALSATALVAGAANPAIGAVIYTENFNGSADGSQSVSGWTLTGDVETLNSNDYRTDAGGTGDTGTGEFLGYGAGDTADNGAGNTDGIAVNAGQTYTLSFDYGSFSQNAGAIQSLEVDVNHTLLTTITTTGSTADLSKVFAGYSYTFTAPTNSLFLTFKDVSTNTGSVDGLLDNISVSGAPEPSTWALMLAGVAALGTGLRMRRKGVGALA